MHADTCINIGYLVLEAGGNDPFGLVSKPLPSHSLNPADRVERNPHY
jgi:hypothetical protein